MSDKGQKPPASGGEGSNDPTLIIKRLGGTSPAPKPPTSGGQGSNEATPLRDLSAGGGTPGEPLRPAPLEPTQPISPRPSSGDATLIGKSALATELPDQKPSTGEPAAPSIHNQETVVSPRLKQLAQTPSQPLRPIPGLKVSPTRR